MARELSPNPDIVKAIRDIVEQGTGRFGFQSLQVDVANDNDGDPVLSIAAHYGENGDPVDVKILGSVTRDVRRKLLELGEERFPHIRYDFPENRKVAAQ